MIQRLLYLGYNLKELDWKKFNRFMQFVSVLKGRSRMDIWKEVLISSFQYNISPMEYFLFRFYEISEEEKKTYAGTGTMYEYQLMMNPKASRHILEDKIEFLNAYSEFVRHNYVELEKIGDDEATNRVMKNASGKIVLKNSKGQCGIGVEVRDSDEFTIESLKKRLLATRNDIVEDYVEQHPALDELSPSGLNTVRIITQINVKGEVDILGARLRITINSSVDNLAAGNIAAPIDAKSGIVTGPGVYSDITKHDEISHPVTGVEIVGFEVPFWNETLRMVSEAALLHPQNRSIGWDVAITRDGPELIEGNHDWCKLLLQLPVKRGLKPILDKHRQAYLNQKR